MLIKSGLESRLLKKLNFFMFFKTTSTGETVTFANIVGEGCRVNSDPDKIIRFQN